MTMLQKIAKFLPILMGSTMGAYLGRCLFLWWDWRAHPDFYAMASAPWYTPLLSGGLITLGLLALEALALALVKRRLKKTIHHKGDNA